MPSLEEVAKELYTSQQAQQGAIGLASEGTNLCKRASLRERIERRAECAERDYARASRMRELAALLEKHPDIARILELMEEL